ncbi:MAG TPA: LysM peptidoglycan-binding domain-containing protein [Bellilinea sp.]|nr:LysM peptidoglycan-binding domain-containing protein [Bellilinea sp.]
MKTFLAFLVGISVSFSFWAVPGNLSELVNLEKPAQQETTPPAPVGGVVVSTPNADGSISHIVKEGESLWSIAVSYGVTISDIKAMNGLTTEDVRAGIPLIIRIAFTPTTLPTATEVPTNTPVPSPTSVGAAAVTATPEVVQAEPAATVEADKPDKKPLLSDTSIGMILIGGSLLGLLLLGISMIRGK